MCARLEFVPNQGHFKACEALSGSDFFQNSLSAKKQIIEQECHGLVEFVDPDHDFSHVGGNEGLKEELMRVAKQSNLVGLIKCHGNACWANGYW